MERKQFLFRLWKLTFLLPLLLTINCTNLKHSNAQSDLLNEGLRKQGHRGCRGLMPENTIPAMLKAIELGVTTLEMDVVITKDMQVVVSHEPFFNHEISAKPDGSFVTEEEEKSLNIYQMTYGKVKTYDVGLKPHPRFPKQKKMAVYKPLLSELFKQVEEYTASKKLSAIYYNIEIKSTNLTDGVYHPAPKEFVDLVMAVIGKSGLNGRVVLQSFDNRPLQYLHKQYPKMLSALLIEDYDKRSFEEQVKELGFTPSIYSPAYQLVDKNLVEKCHFQKMKIIPWTVNDKATIDKLFLVGVDGIISDYPDLF